jgi:dihydrofolate reductase
VIGCDNRLPWHLKTDLARFKQITSNHVVIMGRKTHESIGRVLPNRINIVISRQPGPSQPDLLWVQDLESALFFADHFSIRWDKSTIFVVGGGEIYRLFSDLFNVIYLTEVHAAEVVGDAHLDIEFDFRRWAMTQKTSYLKSSVDEFDSDFIVYERRIRYVRQVELSHFLKEDERVKRILSDSEITALVTSVRRETEKLKSFANGLRLPVHSIRPRVT